MIFNLAIFNMMNFEVTFDYPRLLYLLLLSVAFVPFAAIRWRKSRQSAALFASVAPSREEFRSPAAGADERRRLLKEMRLRMLFSDIFFMLFAAFLVVALASPRWGQRIVPEFRRGVDVMLAFDLSRSMDVRDIEVQQAGVHAAHFQMDNYISRIERAVSIARELVIDIGDEVRIGTAIGRGRGVLAVPLTYDSEVVLSFLYSLDQAGITGRGTNLESIVDAAAASFQDAIPTRRVVILFSDGEELSGSFQQAAERARRAGIVLSAVALGTLEGGFVPVEASAAAPSGFLLAPDGTPVISARQSGALVAGADRTGGVYVSGSRSDAAQVLSAHINALYAQTRLLAHRQESNPRWRLFVIAALTCLAAMKLMGFTLRHSGRTPHSGKGRHYAQ